MTIKRKIGSLLVVCAGLIFFGCSAENNPNATASDDNRLLNGFYLSSFSTTENNEITDSAEYRIDFVDRTISRVNTSLSNRPIDIVYKFGDDGHLISEDTIFEGKVTTQIIERSTDGRLLKITEDTVQGRETLEFTYAQGRIKTKIASNGFSEFVSTYNYDEAGNLSSLVEKFIGDENIDTKTFTYNLIGQRVSTVWDERSDGSVEESSVLQYDENGNLASIEYYSEVGALFSKDEFFYTSTQGKVFNLMNHILLYFP